MMCVYYHRDRKEEWEYTSPRTYKNITQLYEELKSGWIEYLYIYIGNDWYYTETRKKEKLRLKHLKSEFED